MAVDRDVVGRVGEDHLRALVTEQSRIDVRLERVRADDPVRPEDPEIPRTGDGNLVTCRVRKTIVGRITRLLTILCRNQAVDLRDREASHTEIEVELDFEQSRKLDRQDLFVPASLQSQLVVGKHIGPLLSR